MPDYYILQKDGIDYQFELDKSDLDKVILCACAKEEDDYIEEWVEHHLSIGFDKILIADNNDESGRLEPILSKYIEEGKVQIFDFCGVKRLQLDFYHLIANTKNYSWCAFFDIDEFLEISLKYASIKDILNETSENCILVNWLMYGPNGELYKKEGRVQDRFKLPVLPIQTLKENLFFKPILRRDSPSCGFSSSHEPIFNQKGTYNIGGYYTETGDVFQTSYPSRYKKLWLKHYYTKSMEEFQNKINRGWPDGNNQEVLSDINHYYLLDNDSVEPLYRYNDHIFNHAKSNEDSIIIENLKNYDVIFIADKYHSAFNFLHFLGGLMCKCSNHIFCVQDKMEEHLFLTFFELAARTGNKLVAVSKDEDCWDIYTRFGKLGGTYYIYGV